MNANFQAAIGSQAIKGDQPMTCAIDVDTSSVPPAEQFDLFRSWQEGVCDFEPDRDRLPAFPARQMAWNLGTMTATRLRLPGPGSRYRWRHLKRPTVDSWYVFLPLSGAACGPDRKVGKPVVQSLAEPFEYTGEDGGCVALIMPRGVPFIRSSKLEIRHESRQLLADFMLLMDRSLPGLRATDVPHIVAATTSLLAACLTPSRDHIVEARSTIDSVIADRASRIIERRLRDPDLTPQRLCRDLGIARSRLYRVFEPVGGIAAFIRHRRLLRTCNILADSADGRSISTIAQEWGFMDPSVYSRMFRKEFGITPKEARAQGWRGQQPMPVQPPPNDAAQALSTLLLQNCLASGGSTANAACD